MLRLGLSDLLVIGMMCPHILAMVPSLGWDGSASGRHVAGNAVVPLSSSWRLCALPLAYALGEQSSSFLYSPDIY